MILVLCSAAVYIFDVQEFRTPKFAPSNAHLLVRLSFLIFEVR